MAQENLITEPIEGTYFPCQPTELALPPGMYALSNDRGGGLRPAKLIVSSANPNSHTSRGWEIAGDTCAMMTTEAAKAGYRVECLLIPQMVAHVERTDRDAQHHRVVLRLRDEIAGLQGQLDQALAKAEGQS